MTAKPTLAVISDNVCPAAAAAVPHIILGVANLKYEGQALIEGSRYWYINEYIDATSGTKLALEAGKVYKISSIVLGKTIATENPYEETMKVKVVVEVTPWAVVNVNVNPK